MRFETVGGSCLSGLKRLRDDLSAEHTTYAIGLHMTGEGTSPSRDTVSRRIKPATSSSAVAFP